MNKRVLILVGSARENGCTMAAAKTAAQALESIGKRVELIHVGKMTISGCVGCEQCWTNGRICVNRDDMESVYTAVARADLILLATPMYYAAMSAQIKAVVDRFHAIRKSCKRTQIQLAGKECALLVVGHVTQPEKYAGILMQHELMCAHLALHNAGSYVVSGCYHEGDFETLDNGTWPERVASFAEKL